MGEIRRRVETYSVDMVCPVCGVGIMRPTWEMIWPASPPQYPHECDNCGHVQTFNECYPKIEYKAVSGDAEKDIQA